MCCPKRRMSWFLILLACSSLACDGRPSVDSSTTEATVTGVILVKGKPATGGEIQFDPSNVDRPVGPRSAPIGKDGSYSIKTYTGYNRIGFIGSIAVENPGLFRSKLAFEVKKGENHKDFDLLNDSEPSKGPTKTYSKAKR
jgi:hypothetical protein